MCSAHHQADLVHRQPLHRTRRAQPAAVQRRKSVGDFQQFIQILADDHHGRAIRRAVEFSEGRVHEKIRDKLAELHRQEESLLAGAAVPEEIPAR